MQKIAIITSLYNPIGDQRIYDNFIEFCSRLSVEPIVVEAVYNGQSPLTEGWLKSLIVEASDRHILWQKERMLNMCLDLIPDDCEYVAWFDADLIFENENIIPDVIEALQKYEVVQAYENVVRLDDRGGVEFVRSGLVHAMHETGVGDPDSYDRLPDGEKVSGFAAGIAWAARRSILSSCGFPDWMVVGGADAVLVRMMFGEHIHWSRNSLVTDSLEAKVRDWGRRFTDMVQGRVGFVGGDVLHLFHGPMGNRKYCDRYMILEEENYDPDKDIYIDDNGLWAWSDAGGRLAAKVKEYFKMRAKT